MINLHSKYTLSSESFRSFVSLGSAISLGWYYRAIRTTNGLERINKELKRRPRVLGAFPSEQSFMRLGVSILIDINEEWMTAKKYLTMDED